ncbi:hypothetical protein D1223_00085 [Henriciella mobilis]|uniref:Uncharacterized protein n=2 Tax=Henriciella mobilis TaxID=2305467 RepID=A0A399RR11_9PROT|nr:hypothetical protein D1223_00085 [Henriciella mobilis]
MVEFRFIILALVGFGAVLGAVFFGVVVIDTQIAPEVRQLAFYGSNVVILLGLMISILAVFLRRHAIEDVASGVMNHSPIDRSSERREAVE